VNFDFTNFVFLQILLFLLWVGVNLFFATVHEKIAKKIRVSMKKILLPRRFSFSF
jgi:hypothetical protein